jgi:hypothetical protein
MSAPPLLPLFVVPLRNLPTLCCVEAGRLVAVGPTPIPPGAEYALSAGGWMAWFLEGSGTIQRAHGDAEPHEQQRFAPLVLPQGWEAARLAFHGDVLYVGAFAERGGRALGAVDWTEPFPVFRLVETPKEMQADVSGFFLDGNRLIVLPGNDVSFLVHAVTDPLRPHFQERRVLPVRSNSEDAEEGAAGRSWLGILAFGWGFGEELQFISLIDRAGLEEQGRALQVRHHSMFIHGAVDPPDPPTWHRLAWADDTLLIAAGKHGVGVLDLGAAPPLGPPQRRDGRVVADPLGRWCDDHLVYLPAQGEVIRVLPVPSVRQALAVCRSGQECDTVLLRLP